MLHTLTELENNTHTHTLGHAHTQRRTGYHKMAKTFKSTEAVAQKAAQFLKSNTQPYSHSSICLHTHKPKIFLLDLSLPRCNRINEPITGYGSSHGFKEIKIIILPPYCVSVCIFVCAGMCLFMHGWDQWENLSQCVLRSICLYLQWRPVALSTSYLAVLSSKKTREKEGSNVSLRSVILCCSPARSDLSFTFSVYFRFHCFVKLLFAVKFSCSNRWNIDDLEKKLL